MHSSTVAAAYTELIFLDPTFIDKMEVLVQLNLHKQDSR